MAFFHFQAISIQRTFRGFDSRRRVHDFYARKKYIASVLEQSRRVREQLAQHRATQEEEKRKKESSDQRVEFDEITENLHHLLSTQSQPGIYNSPFIQEDLPTAFNQPIEDHIKTSFKNYISKKGGVETIGLQKMRERAKRPMSRCVVLLVCLQSGEGEGWGSVLLRADLLSSALLCAAARECETHNRSPSTGEPCSQKRDTVSSRRQRSKKCALTSSSRSHHATGRWSEA